MVLLAIIGVFVLLNASDAGFTSTPQWIIGLALVAIGALGHISREIAERRSQAIENSRRDVTSRTY